MSFPRIVCPVKKVTLGRLSQAPNFITHMGEFGSTKIKKKLKAVLRFNLIFPGLKSCNWNRKSWYDTILGAAEADVGVVNSMDFESLAKQTRQCCAGFVSGISNQCSIVAHDISVPPKYH